MKTKKATTPNELRLFTFIVSLGMFLIFWGIPFYKYQTSRDFVIYGVLVFLLLGVFFPHLMALPRNYWIKLGEVLGHFNGLIIFSFLYFTLFLFFSLIFKLSKRDKLKMYFKKYSTLKSRKSEISSFENMF